MLITPFYWLLAPWYRRSERTTVAEIVEDRYGQTLGLVYTLFAIVFFVFAQGTMLKGVAKAVAGATGEAIPRPTPVVVAMMVVFVSYSFVGGLVAAAYTNMVQGLLIILSFLHAHSCRAGGGRRLSGIRAAVPADFFELYNERSGVGGFTILMLALNGLVGITAQPQILTMAATGRQRAWRASRLDLWFDGQASLRRGLGADRPDRGRNGCQAWHLAPGSRGGVWLRLPALPWSGACRPDGGFAGRRQHVGVLELSW